MHFFRHLFLKCEKKIQLKTFRTYSNFVVAPVFHEDQIFLYTKQKVKLVKAS